MHAAPALLVLLALGQALENTGKPIQVPSPCTEEDLRALGLTCPPEQPCPVYLELSQMERVAEKIFLTGNLHTDSATVASILLASEDGGKTWHEPHDRVRGAVLDQIQFYDFEAGWAVGHLVEAMSRDPFLLVTTDGGKTWRRRPLWSESRLGSIDHVWFDSRTHGFLWVDRGAAGEAGRHELYESMTGGESWMLRQASDRPIKRQGARTPNPDWRLRADAASGSYRLERRVPKWEPVASFLIRAGECKEKEAALPEPPPPAEPQPAEPAPPKPPRKKPTLKKP